MQLSARFDCVRHESQADAACGLILFDQATARPIQQSAWYLGKTNSTHHALLLGLIRTLELAVPRASQRLEINCTSELLVRQITGEMFAADAAERALCEQAMTLLLQLDSWQVRLTEDADRAAVTQLARRALEEACDVSDLDIEQAPLAHHPEHTGVPQWTVQLLEDPGRTCPAQCPAHKRYPFGPDTPASLCVYAAIAGLMDGPLNWPDLNQNRMTTSCSHCGTPLRIERANSDSDL